tara:strand:- start:858 stop:1112 length:255 start_codon:yes stop_codon:yes gene_type:complete
MKEEDYLSETTQAVLTVLSTAMILFSFASGSNIAAVFAILSMVMIKYYAIKCYDKKMDKFYFIAFSLCAIGMVILEILLYRNGS